MSLAGLKQAALTHAIADIKVHEAFRAKAYRDTVGVWTIGYGFTAGVREGDTITRQRAEEYLLERVLVAVRDARVLLGPAFDALDGPRQAIMINMSFNLGRTRLGAFVSMLAAVRAGDYNRAAAEMVNSKWCRQVKTRCVALERAMRAGHYLTH